MIQHTVTFRLKHAHGSDQEQQFLVAARALSSIPGVENFKVLRQIGRKNNFTFGLSMAFNTESEYEAYNSHPEHVRFVETVWIPEVEDFLEIDYLEIL